MPTRTLWTSYSHRNSIFADQAMPALYLPFLETPLAEGLHFFRTSRLQDSGLASLNKKIFFKNRKGSKYPMLKVSRAKTPLKARLLEPETSNTWTLKKCSPASSHHRKSPPCHRFLKETTSTPKPLNRAQRPLRKKIWAPGRAFSCEPKKVKAVSIDWGVLWVSI